MAEVALNRSPLSIFEHTALPNDSEYIRLFEIRTENIEPFSITCHLTAWNVAEAPLYHAISYVCGDTIVTEAIRMNDKNKTVGKNCAEVLRQLQHFQTSQFYWMDALCINQDDLDEKAHQVAKMGLIFERADHVLACLGTTYEDSEYAMRMIGKADEYYKTFEPHLDVYEDLWWQPQATRLSVYNALLGELPGIEIKRFITSVLGLLRRPYFSRVWVLQEALLARRLSFCIGHQCQSKKALEWHFDNISDTFQRIFRGQPFLDRLHHAPSLADAASRYDNLQQFDAEFRNPRIFFNAFSPAISTVTYGVKEYQGRLGRNYVPASTLLNLCAQRLCEDPRDTIFGTLALTRWDGREQITPDYTRSSFDLAVEYAGALDDEKAARTLLKNLKIDREHPTVQANVSVRRQVTHDLSGDLVLAQDLSHAGRIQVRFHGKQLRYSSLLHHSHDDAGEAFPVTRVTVASDGSNVSAYVPISTQLGDIIVWRDDYQGPEGLILRQIQQDFNDHPPTLTLRNGIDASDMPRYIILGRAWMSQEIAPILDGFFVFFDPEDLLMYVLTSDEEVFAATGTRYMNPSEAQPPTLAGNEIRPGDKELDRLNISLCKRPFSSFAVHGPPKELEMFKQNIRLRSQ